MANAVRRWVVISTILLALLPAHAAQRYSATGMVLNVDRARKTFTASCEEIKGFMPAMTMPFEVREPKELDGLAPGQVVEFKLVVDRGTSYAEDVKIRPYVSAEQDPRSARQLKLLGSLSERAKSAPKPLEVGSEVPNFTLTDQTGAPVSLAQFAGKVVAINFIYTSCALPTFCYRIANNFGVLQRRFKDAAGRDLVLLTVTFDPERDTPEVLARYAQTWRADPKKWHFLTGAVPDVRRVTGMFGVDFFPDEGLMNHSLHTAVIDRQGKLVANIEGNQFTSAQFGDLVKTVLEEKPVGSAPHAHGQR